MIKEVASSVVPCQGHEGGLRRIDIFECQVDLGEGHVCDSVTTFLGQLLLEGVNLSWDALVTW